MTKAQKTIFVVDDNNANLTACKNILKPYYVVYPLPSAAKMFELAKNVTPELIIMDVEMPEMNGYEAVGKMKKDEALKSIPVIFLSGRTDPASETFGLNMGALDYIHKPIVSELLLRRIEMHLSLIDYRRMLEGASLARADSLSRITNEIRDPIKIIIEMTDTALASDDAGTVKNCLARAGEASRELLKLLDGADETGALQP